MTSINDLGEVIPETTQDGGINNLKDEEETSNKQPRENDRDETSQHQKPEKSDPPVGDSPKTVPVLDNEKEPSIVKVVQIQKQDNSTENPDQNDNIVLEHETKANNKTESTRKEAQKNEDDMDEYDPDLYITDEERKAFSYMLDQRREELVKQKEKFQNWVDSLTRRRMFALSRLRKINKSHKDRMEFYDKIDNYLHSADTVINTTAKNSDNLKEQSNGSKFEDIVRENTGFVLNSNNSESKGGKGELHSNTSDTKETIVEKGKDTDDNVSKKTSDESHTKVLNVDDDSKQNVSHNNENTPKIVPVQS